MSQKRKRAPHRPKSTLELVLEKKGKALLAAERKYWETVNSLREQHAALAVRLGLSYEDKLPSSVSSTVWALKDGVAFVRYKTVGGKARVDFRVAAITLEEWGRNGLVVPLETGEVSLARIGLISGVANISLYDCSVNELHIPYAEFAHLRYGEEAKLPSVESAVLDFQLAVLALQAQQTTTPPQPSVTSKEVTAILRRLAQEFETLLDTEGREEELQAFLKQHPFILHPSAECIPKQKLGEDFVTDFVLVETRMQGPRYVLVELERASHPLLTEKLILSGPVNQAIKQTRDWDVWLEQNKAYVQNKLPGFETPSYLVIIGRAKNLTDQARSYLRSYNRNWKDIELLTYDDLLWRLAAMTQKLGAMGAGDGKYT